MVLLLWILVSGLNPNASSSLGVLYQDQHTKTHTVAATRIDSGSYSQTWGRHVPQKRQYLKRWERPLTKEVLELGREEHIGRKQ